MKLRYLSIFAAMTLSSVVALAQNPVTTDSPFQVRYASNLPDGDSFINITNTGAEGAAFQSGTTASITGALCANVYTFSPDEQLISCCSCPVTPDGLVSLSARNDLISNTLTPGVPTSIVIKLLATRPVGGSCNNSAATVLNGAVLVPGMLAWGTTIHPLPVTPGSPAGTYAMTESRFEPSTLSAGELNRIGNLCSFILANGSGFGVCRSCRLGGLASVQE